MSIFQDALDDAKGLEVKLMGESYPYSENITTPSKLGMSDKGTLSTLSKDISGLIAYSEVLTSGTGKASATGKPLGNRFFLQTGAKCTAPDGSEQDRYIYINNIPSGSIPFVSSATGQNFKSFRGLIPGVMTNLEALNPLNILRGFMMGSAPDCQEITLETVDTHNVHGTDTHYIATVDIKDMDACDFQNRKNPITGEKCKETFATIEDTDDWFVKLYYAALGVGAIWILSRINQKR